MVGMYSSVRSSLGDCWRATHMLELQCEPPRKFLYRMCAEFMQVKVELCYCCKGQVPLVRNSDACSGLKPHVKKALQVGMLQCPPHARSPCAFVPPVLVACQQNDGWTCFACEYARAVLSEFINMFLLCATGPRPEQTP
eukprot:4051802-Amphidinium_carterae.1